MFWGLPQLVQRFCRDIVGQAEGNPHCVGRKFGGFAKVLHQHPADVFHFVDKSFPDCQKPFIRVVKNGCEDLRGPGSQLIQDLLGELRQRRDIHR